MRLTTTILITLFLFTISISAAYACTPYNGTIVITTPGTTTFCPGTYSMNGYNGIVIQSDNVTIQCENTVFDSTHGSNVRGIFIESDIYKNILIQNCTFTNVQSDGVNSGTAIVGDGINITVNKCSFYNDQYGVSLGNGDESYVYNSVFEGGAQGILFGGGNNSEVANNTILNMYNQYGTAGIDLGGWTDVNVSAHDNILRNVSQSGILKAGYNNLNVSIYNNIIDQGMIGFYFAGAGGGGITLRNNTISNMSQYGIYFGGSYSQIAISNQLTDNNISILIAGSGSNTVTNNVLKNAAYGVELGGADNNQFDNNTFSNITVMDIFNQGGSNGNLITIRSNGNIFRLNSSNLNINNIASNFYMQGNVVAVNAAAEASMNVSTHVTLTFAGICPATIYYAPQYSTSFDTIKSTGQACNAGTNPACSNIVCSGNHISFDVPHFDSYGAEGTPDSSVPEFDIFTMMIAAIAVTIGISLFRKGR